MNKEEGAFVFGMNIACLLKKYIGQYLPVAMLFLVFVGIFASVFSLYDLETETVWYACELCMFVMVPVLGIHFYFFVRRHKERMMAKDTVGVTLHLLPKPNTLL